MISYWLQIKQILSSWNFFDSKELEEAKVSYLFPKSKPYLIKVVTKTNAYVLKINSHLRLDNDYLHFLDWMSSKSDLVLKLLAYQKDCTLNDKVYKFELYHYIASASEINFNQDLFYYIVNQTKQLHSQMAQYPNSARVYANHTQFQKQINRSIDSTIEAIEKNQLKSSFLTSDIIRLIPLQYLKSYKKFIPENSNKQIVHGDLHPGNMILLSPKELKFIDFENSIKCYESNIYDLAYLLQRFVINSTKNRPNIETYFNVISELYKEEYHLRKKIYNHLIYINLKLTGIILSKLQQINTSTIQKELKKFRDQIKYAEEIKEFFI